MKQEWNICDTGAEYLDSQVSHREAGMKTVALVETLWLSLGQIYSTGVGVGWKEEKEECLVKEKAYRPGFVCHPSVTSSALTGRPSRSAGHSSS